MPELSRDGVMSIWVLSSMVASGSRFARRSVTASLTTEYGRSRLREYHWSK